VSQVRGEKNRKSKPQDSRVNCDVNVKLDLKVDRTAEQRTAQNSHSMAYVLGFIEFKKLMKK
jgi:hypothetical protein